MTPTPYARPFGRAPHRAEEGGEISWISGRTKMIRGNIQLQAETAERLRIALEIIGRSVVGSCSLDDPEGEQHYGGDLDDSITVAHFQVLPEYREGDLEKFVGCDPNFTGGLSTEEHIDRIRGGADAFDQNTEGMIFYGFRYCLGRATYAVNSCVDYLIANWQRITPDTQFLIQRDIQEAFRRNEYGMEMDRAQWQRVLELPAPEKGRG